MFQTMAISVSFKSQYLLSSIGAQWAILTSFVEHIQVRVSLNEDVPVLREDQIIHDFFIPRIRPLSKYVM
jgi:hypothetical protein